MTKTDKRFLTLFLTAAGVLVIGGIAVVLAAMYRLVWSNPFEVRFQNGFTEVETCAVKDGAGQDYTAWDLPLPIYSFTPGPEWTQTQNAQDTANRLSWEYQDEYQNPQGDTLTFSQEMAVQGEYLPAQRMELVGDTHLFFYQGPSDIWAEDTVTRIFWIYGGSLLTITRSGPVSDSEMLGLFEQVDVHALRQPVYTPLTIQPEESQETAWDGSVTTYRYYRVQGNPEIPQDFSFCGFPQPPTGYTLEDSQWVQPMYNDINHLTRIYRCYPDRMITYDCWVGTKGIDSLLWVPAGEEVQQVTVQGNPGLIYCASGHWEMVWWDDYRIMQLSSYQYMTPEAFLAMAEQVQPVDDRPAAGHWYL